MKNIIQAISKRKYVILLCLFVASYIAYFSYFTVLRYHTLYASYFDLGIMQQTVYNTYQAFVTGDMNRVLELTDPHGGVEQIKRMAVHNDVILAALAPLYFLYSGPETLLIVQTVVLALGAVALYFIVTTVFEKHRLRSLIALVFAGVYLMNPALQKANMFDFHAVTFATSFLLWAFYLFLKKRYGLSVLLVVLSLLTKEQVGLTTAFFGLYALFKSRGDKHRQRFGMIVFLGSVVWFALSVFVIIPYFRQSGHFALRYYGDFGDSPAHILLGLLSKPLTVFEIVFRQKTFVYLTHLAGPLFFLPFLSPTTLIALPELAINILSKSDNMRNIYYHYTAVITPFLFIGGVYGARTAVDVLKKYIPSNRATLLILVNLIVSTAVFSYFKGPLPYAREKQIHPFVYPAKEARNVFLWARTFQSENWKVAATGHVAPFFASRRYFYPFNEKYDLADVIVLTTNEAPKEAYEKLVRDPTFVQIFKTDKLEVYRKVNYNE